MIQPQGEMPVRRFTRPAMACVFELYLVEADAKYARQAAQAALAEVERLEQELSRFIPTSDIARLNGAVPGAPVRVSADTLACLQLAAEIYSETGGAFDITFQSAPPAAPADAGPPLVLDPASHAVGVRRPGVVVDLGGIGKGYALDRAAAVLREWGIAAALLHAGQSTVYALGRPAADRPWRVALRSPEPHGRPLGRLTLEEQALSGSGQRLHGGHVVDPRTGRPAGAARAAWAVAPQAGRADALSTALLVMAPAQVERLCRLRADVSAILVPAASAGQEVVCVGARVNLA